MSRKKVNVYSFTNFKIKQSNLNVIKTLRTTGLFKTNEEVIDAALRLLVERLKKEFSTSTLTELPTSGLDSLSLPEIEALPKEPGNPEEQSLPVSPLKE